MFLGTLLLTSLVECFSFQVELKVKLLPDIDLKEGIISPDWEHSIPNRNCTVSSWVILKGKASTCNLGSSLSENCTLVSPDYDVTKANELFITVATETRNCTSVSKDKICKETFSLLAFYRDSKKQNKAFKKFLGPIPASPLTASVLPQSNFSKTKSVISFSRDQRYSHIKLGFQESSYCGTVGPVSMFYYKCPTKTSELVDFENASAPSKSASPKIMTGKCTNDAVPENDLLNMKCYYNGTFVVFGSCKCKAGFEKAHSKCQG